MNISHASDHTQSPGPPAGRRRTPTTAAERWTEVVETSHYGLAVLDTRFRFVFVSEQAGATLGVRPDDALGRAIADVVPEIGAVGALALRDVSLFAEPARFEIRQPLEDGNVRSVRITLVGRPSECGTTGVFVLTHDVTAMRSALAERLAAQRSLTAIDIEEHRRISSEIHDGPVQILAALTLRLSAMTEPGIDADRIAQLQGATDAASAELRRMINEPVRVDATPVSLLRSWAEPLIAATPLRLDIADHSDPPPNRATTQSLFVLLHEFVKLSAADPEATEIRVRLTGERSGYRLTASVPLDAAATDDARAQARRLAAGHYAQLLGGSFEQESTPGSTRTIDVWVPRQADDRSARSVSQPIASPSQPTDGPPAGSAGRGRDLDLTDDDWDVLARASQEGLVEVDADLRVMRVNAAYEHAMQRPAAEIVGSSPSDMYRPQDLEFLEPHIRRLQQGETVRLEWQRPNGTGEPRWTLVAASPRFDDGGRFEGALFTSLDTTDLHLIEELRDSALLDVELARRTAQQSFVRGLHEGPLPRLDEVNSQLTELIGSHDASPAIRTIQAGLARSIARLRRSIGVLTEPDVADRTLTEVLHESLATVLDATDAELVVEDRTEQHPSPALATAIVRIAREATTNAVLHGKADRVTVTVSQQASRYRLQVLDNGDGLATGALRPAPGHLGLRTMTASAAEQNGSLRVVRGPLGGTLVSAWFQPTSESIGPGEDVAPGTTSRRTPTTTSERWAEVIETAHEGFAVLDADRCFEFASDRAAASVGADVVAGLELTSVVPELRPTDLASIDAAAERGEPTRMMITRRIGDQGIRALRLTFVPRRRDGGGAGGWIVLTHDITALRVVQDQRRRAQHRLTAVEDEEQQRLAREIHDGPIQILAALVLRLGATEVPGLDRSAVIELEEAVHLAGQELREIIVPAAPAHDDAAEALLARWAGPMLAGSGIDLHVEDRGEEPPNRATTEALFVFLHEVLRSCLSHGLPSSVHAVLTTEHGGHRFDITASANDPVEDDTGAGATDRYAGLFGGWHHNDLSDPQVRRVSAWLPSLEERGWAVDADPPGSTVHERPSRLRPSVPGTYPVLSDADREAVTLASTEGVMELDADLRITHVSDAYATAMGKPASDLVGRPFEQLFTSDDYARLGPYIERVRRGVPVRFEWQRRNALGQPRWTQVAGSPRLAADGRFDGALMMTLDTTELHLAEDYRDAVLADLDRARRVARQRTWQRLNDGPIERLEGVVDRLSRRVENGRPDQLIATIERELRQSISALRVSAGEMAYPDLSEVPWTEVLRSSLTAQLSESDTQLILEGPTDLQVPQARAESLVKIAREAVTNAVRHGRAERVRVSIEQRPPDVRLLIADDGSGITNGDLDPDPRHLGVRSMSERAADLKGDLQIEPRVDGGTVVTVTIPALDHDTFDV